MPHLDIFNNSAFDVMSLTESINSLPYVPGRISNLNLFHKQGVTTTHVSIESKGGLLQLIPSAARGSHQTVAGSAKRKLRPIIIPHFPLDDAVIADEVQNVRSFGSEGDVAAVSSVVADKLQALRDSHELTHEFLRLGAIKGQVIDGNGTDVLLDSFAEFGVAQDEVKFYLDDDDEDEVKLKSLAVIRLIEEALGGIAYNGIRALVGNDFWDKLITNAGVKAAFNTYLEDRFTLVQQDRENGFEFAGIVWENYRGKVGSEDFIASDAAHFFPMGVPRLFIERYAPADFMETVNTVGKPFYVKQERMAYDKGVSLHSQSNIITLCTRPKTLILGTYEPGGSGS